MPRFQLGLGKRRYRRSAPGRYSSDFHFFGCVTYRKLTIGVSYWPILYAVMLPASAHGGRGISMKNLFLLTALLLPQVSEPQKRPVRIAFSSTSTVAASDVRKAFAKKCPRLQLTSDPSRSDYALEAMAETINPVFATEVTRYRFTLFNRSGNAFYSTSPHRFSNAINNVCMAIDRQKRAQRANINK